MPDESLPPPRIQWITPNGALPHPFLDEKDWPTLASDLGIPREKPGSQYSVHLMSVASIQGMLDDNMPRNWIYVKWDASKVGLSPVVWSSNETDRLMMMTKHERRELDRTWIEHKWWFVYTMEGLSNNEDYFWDVQIKNEDWIYLDLAMRIFPGCSVRFVDPGNANSDG